MANNQNKGGGARKYGRNTLSCAAYKQARKATKNKARRILRHLKAHPEDASALAAAKQAGIHPTTVATTVAAANQRDTARMARQLHAVTLPTTLPTADCEATRKGPERWYEGVREATRAKEAQRYESYLWNRSGRSNSTMAMAYREALRTRECVAK